MAKKKKSFDDLKMNFPSENSFSSPALAFFSIPNDDAPDNTFCPQDSIHTGVHDDTHINAHQTAQTDDFTDAPQKNNAHTNTHDKAHSDAHTEAQKKAQINLALNSHALKKRAEIQAERQGISVTEYINNLILADIARSDYPDNKKRKK